MTNDLWQTAKISFDLESRVVVPGVEPTADWDTFHFAIWYRWIGSQVRAIGGHETYTPSSSADRPWPILLQVLLDARKNGILLKLSIDR